MSSGFLDPAGQPGAIFERSQAAIRAELRAAFRPRLTQFAIVDPLVDLGPRAPKLDVDLAALVDELQAELDRKIAAAKGKPILGGGLVATPHPLIPEDTIVLLSPASDALDVEDRGDRFAVVLRARPAYYNPRRSTGDPSTIERRLNPTPGYTPYTLGGREAARDRRKHR